MGQVGRRRAASTAATWCWWLVAKSKVPSSVSLLHGPPLRSFLRRGVQQRRLSYRTMRTLTTIVPSSPASHSIDSSPDRNEQQWVDRSSLTLYPPAIEWADSSTLSLSSLQDRMHWFVQHQSQLKKQQQQQQQQQQTPPQPESTCSGSCRLVAAVAGGGGHFVSTLAATPRASAVLLQGSVLYDRESWHSYLNQFRSTAAVDSTATIQNDKNHGTASCTSADVDESSHSNDNSSSNNNNNNNNNSSRSQKFQYASLAAARLLSVAALEQACQISASGVTAALVRMESSITRDRAQAAQLKSNVFDRRNLLHRYLTQPVGVACSSALQTTVTGNSSESTKTAKSQAADQRESQAHIVVNRPDGREVHELSMVIKNVGLSRSTNPGDVGDEGQSTPAPVQEQDPDRRLTRFLEDVVVAHGILSCIECAVLGADGSFSHSSDSTKSDASSADHDVVVDYRVQRAPELVPTPECYQTRTIYHATNELSQASPIVVNEATNRIFSCQNSVVALVPEYHPSFMTACDRDSVSKDEPSQGSCRVSFSVLTRFALPPSSVVFPGSFNPIHDGHVQLAKAAVDAVPQVRNVVWFELALTNADKPSLSVEEVRRRVQFFAEYFTQNNDDENGFQWGILLTNAPLFRQKVELLQPLIVPSGASSHGRTDAVSDELNLDMIIGVDTLVRLSDPKYYDGSHKKMVEAIRSMPVRFVVGGRVAQPTSGSANTTAPKDIRHGEPPSAQFSSDTSFITGHDQVAQLPEDLQSKFVLLSEDSFRVDISSTEIRRNCRKKYHG